MIIIGDIHSIKPIFELIDKNKWEGQNLIQVGDFGLGFQEIRRDIENLLLLDEALVESNNKLYVVRGNHDNPIFWDKSKGLNLPKFHNLVLVQDYQVITIENKNVLFIGGAISLDRKVREFEKPYPTWWKDEEFIYNYSKLFTACKNINLDVVITHNSPDFAYPAQAVTSYLVDHYHQFELQHGGDLKKDINNERLDITEMYNNITIDFRLRPKYWCYGHFHESHIENIDGTEFKLLDIKEAYEIK